MPYHITKPSILGSAVPDGGVEYYTGENKWDNEYSKRKIYTNKADADAQVATVETRTLGDRVITYQSKWWKDATVVTE